MQSLFAGDEHKFAGLEHMFAVDKHKFTVHELKIRLADCPLFSNSTIPNN